VAIGPYELTVRELVAVRAVDRLGTPHLLLRDGGGELVLHALTVSPVRLGRAPESDLIVDWDPEVSRAHVRFEDVGGRWSVVDDGLSRNGTWIGEQRVSGRRLLAGGEVIRIGRTSLVFRAPRDGASETVVSVDAAGAISLTPGEHRVLTELCRPCLADPGAPLAPASNQDIADALVLSIPGVKTHLRSLFAKFDVDDLPQNRKRSELARRAIATGTVRA
jgi:pSer/pThr/pTyr-binding forkhead associated (FHA) protein